MWVKKHDGFSSDFSIQVLSEKDSKVRVGLIDDILVDIEGVLSISALEALQNDPSIEEPVRKLYGLIEERLQARNDAVQITMPEPVVSSRINERDNLKVSIVVPIYNGMPFIAQTLESLLSQVENEIEIICIDDGSIDGTLAFLREMALQHHRISVWHQENHGLSYTRNVGLLLASGKYVYFIDADDTLANDAIKTFWNVAYKNDLDIVYCDASSFYESEGLKELYPWFEGAYERKGDYGDRVWRGAELAAEFVQNGDDYAPVWLAFYNREFLLKNRLFFHNGILHEDNAYLFQAAIAAKRVMHIKEKLLNRRVREGSIMTGGSAFRNVYGYFSCALDVLNAEANSGDLLSQEERTLIQLAAFRLLGSAQREFAKLSIVEREKYLAYEEGGLLYQTVVQPARAKMALESVTQKLHDKELEIADLALENERCVEEMVALEDELLNMRDALRERNDAYIAVKQSASYRLGHAALAPLRFLRRLVSRG